MAQSLNILSKLIRRTQHVGLLQARTYSSGSIPTTKMLINGKFMESNTDSWIPITNPATNEIISYCPESTEAEKDAAAKAASDAFESWSETSIMARQQVCTVFDSIVC